MSVSSFKNNLNKKCVIKVKVETENEYIQGILTKVDDKSFTITQIIPYHNFLKKEKYQTLERQIMFDAKIEMVEHFYD